MLNADTLTHYRNGLKALEKTPGIRHLAGNREQQPHLAAPQLYQADVNLLLSGNPLLQEEVFGPVAILVAVEDNRQLAAALESLQGQLTTPCWQTKMITPMRRRWLNGWCTRPGECCLTGIPPG